MKSISVRNLSCGCIYPLTFALLATVIREFHLPRTRRKPMYYGRAEVQLLFEQALRGTVSTGRPVKIKDNAIMAMSMYTGVRPSSLTAPYTEYLDERRVSTLAFSSALSLLRSPV